MFSFDDDDVLGSDFQERRQTLGLPLLKQLHRERLQHLNDSISQQENQQKLAGWKMMGKSLEGISWKWQADDNSWHSFEPEEQQRLEHAVKTGQKTVSFMNNIHFMHTVDLVCMERINMRTGFGKKIQRIPSMNFMSKNVSKGAKCRSNGFNFDLDCADNHDDDSGKFSMSPRFSTSPPFSASPRFSTNWETESHSGFGDNGIDFLGSRKLSVDSATTKTTTLPTWSRYKNNSSRPIEGCNGASNGRSKQNIVDKTNSKKVGTRAYKTQAEISKTLAKQNDVKKLKTWLKNIDLDKYYDKFTREKISLKELCSLTEKDLEKLGLPMGARKRFLERVKEVGSQKEPPNEYLCPISMGLMKDPVILCDGFSYERSAIERWLQKHNKSPMTNEDLDSKLLTPNRQLKKLIEDFEVCQIDE